MKARLFPAVTLHLAGLLLATAMFGPPLHAAAETRVFKAGAATSNVTPRLGTYINTDRPATHIHDELLARCLVLDDGRTRLAFAIVDGCIIHQEAFDLAKQRVHEKTQLPIDHILISSTHTHSAPDAVGRPQGTLNPEEQKSKVSRIVDSLKPDRDPIYYSFLSERIADGIIRAINNLEPARIAWGRGLLPDHLFNRRWFMKPGSPLANPFGGQDRVRMNPGAGNPNLLQPAGPTDPQVNFISLQSPGGTPIALLANYSLHYVGGVGGGDVSADYFGAFATRIGEMLGADRKSRPFVGMLCNGTSGDVNNTNFLEPRPRQPPYQQIQRVANSLAAEVFKIHQQIEFRDWVSLDVIHRRIELGVRLPTEPELVRAREIVKRAKAYPRMQTPEEVYAREAILLSGFAPTVPVYLQAIRIGDVAIGAIPCETFAESGLDVKARSPFPSTFSISLANGYHGYMPTARQHEWGGYETWRARSSYLEKDAASKVVDTLVELFGELRTRDGRF
jgi:neutral ceramidase